jgi:AraC-like DNA-binding protein
MKRAVELFDFERRASSSSLVTTTWQTTSEPEPEASFISVAECHWEMVVTRQGTAASLTVRGPETKATPAPIPTDAEFFGIQFSLGTFMPSVDMRRLADNALTLPAVSSTKFWLDGCAWELPGPDTADVFVDRLVRAGLLVHDPVASAALNDDVDGLSTRAVERRVARATGLTRGTIRQIGRAERALELLGRGVAPLEAARQAGYADQPHLTRSLKRFVGQTPSQIAPTPSPP